MIGQLLLYTSVQSQHAGFSARARSERVLMCNLLTFENPTRARFERVLVYNLVTFKNPSRVRAARVLGVRTRYARGMVEHG